jgi:hypothetical protein
MYIRFCLVGIVMITLVTSLILHQTAEAVDWNDPTEPRTQKAPPAKSGDNIYVVWWNGTGGEQQILK